MHLLQLVESREEDHSAWNKAPADVSAILDDMGFRYVVLQPRRHGRLRALVVALRFLAVVPFGSTLVVQTPAAYWGRLNQMTLLFTRRFKRIRLVTVVHDIVTFRDGVGDSSKEDHTGLQDQLFRHSDRLICHNEKMRAWLVEHGVDEKRIVCLGIFDYLVNRTLETSPRYAKSLTFAGNLDLTMNGFLKKIKTLARVQWNLYGSHYDETAVSGENVHYHGIAKAEELPRKLNEGFGLIWYGDSIETCDGVMSRYAKVNNPHKLSLCLAAGIPVVVWREAAIADFVAENKVGLVVDSLMEAASRIVQMSAAEYEGLARNVADVSRKLRAGWYTRQAIEKALS